MDFEFTADHTLLRDRVRRFVTREYTFGRRRAILESPCGFSAELWRRMAQLGFFGVGLPKEAGGCGGALDVMLVMEELGRGLVLEPFLSTVVLGAALIRDYGTMAQRARLLPKIVAGGCRVALAHYEADARHVLDYVSTSARRGRGAYVLNGRKPAVPDGSPAEMLIVSARDESAGGISLFMVTPGLSGLTVSPYRTPDGRSAADVILEDVKVLSAARLGSPGAALTALEQTVDCALAALCAEAVGIIEAVNDITSGVQRRMADMFLMAAQARSMSYLATRRCRQPDRAERRRVLWAAKAFIGKAARCIGQQALAAHGGAERVAGTPLAHYTARLSVLERIFTDERIMSRRTK